MRAEWLPDDCSHHSLIRSCCIPEYPPITQRDTNTLSLIVAGLLILAYIAWLIFSMVTHKSYLADVTDDQDEELPHEHAPAWSKKKSILYLVIATVMVAFVSEWLVGTLEVFTSEFGLSELFVGAFLVAIIGNAAEHSAAIMLAMKNKIGAAVEIAVGSSLQIALFVAPVLIFVSYFTGRTMDIVFTTIELVAIGVSVLSPNRSHRTAQPTGTKGCFCLLFMSFWAFRSSSFNRATWRHIGARPIQG